MLVVKMVACGCCRRLAGGSWRDWWTGVVSTHVGGGYGSGGWPEKLPGSELWLGEIEQVHSRSSNRLIGKGYWASELKAFWAYFT